MARRRAHPLVAAVRNGLPHPAPASSGAYLALLERRLAALGRIAAGGGVAWVDRPRDRTLARRFLRPLEGLWDDGDETLVRGDLDRWVAPGEDALRAAARGLSTAADRLARIDARPTAYWFLLWEMESILAGPPFLADNARRPC